MTQRLERACEILKYAIKHRKSLALSSKECGYNKGYVTNTKRFCKDMEGYDKFMVLYDQLFKKPDVNKDELLSDEKVTPGIKFTEEQKNKGILDARGNKHVKSLDDILKEAKVDLNLWNVDRHVVNKWDVTTKHGKTYQNWQVKIWLTKRPEIAQAVDFEVFYEKLLAKHNPFKYKTIAYLKHKEKNLLEVALFDLHLGKLCWSEEVENNYDIKIASNRFNYALSTIVERARSSKFERILYPIGNDFFNSDGHLNQTTLGTRQDEDSRWQKTFNTGIALQVQGIDFLRQFAPVDILVIPGNHDWTKSFFLGTTLKAWYRNDKSVTVNNSANPRKYYEYGNVLLGFTHGNNEKHEALRSLMADEAREAWARTRYKEWHVGHQHRKLAEKYIVKSNMLHEELGVKIRAMASLAGTDAWHHMMGYKGPIRAGEAFMWNSEAGETASFTVNVKLNDDL